MSRASRNQAVKKLHDDRAAKGLCIYDRRELGGEPHGPPVKARRCDECYDKALESNRESAKRKRIAARRERLHPTPVPTARTARLVPKRSKAAA
jgi:hypothetical protein